MCRSCVAGAPVADCSNVFAYQRNPWEVIPNFFFCIVKEFDIAARLDTVPELVDRVYNRPTIATLQRETVKGPTDPVHLKVLLLFVLQSSSWFAFFI